MVLFRRKRQSDRRELLASMNQMAVGKPVDNGELNVIITSCFSCFTLYILRSWYKRTVWSLKIFKQLNAGKREMCVMNINDRYRLFNPPYVTEPPCNV